MTPPPPELAVALGLVRHPEGGWYRETWRSEHSFAPAGYAGERSAATAILYLLGPGERSAWHQVRSAELWLHHQGPSLRLTLGGSGPQPSADPMSLLLGNDLAAGELPQALVPAGTWQTAAPEGDTSAGGAVLVSCVVSPGFDFADWQAF